MQHGRTSGTSTILFDVCFFILYYSELIYNQCPYNVFSYTYIYVLLCVLNKDQSINESINQSMYESINESINQSINQSMNQSMYESINV